MKILLNIPCWPRQVALGLLLLIWISAASACNMPGLKSDSSPTPDVTQAYQTVEARLTEAANLTPLSSPTETPSETPISGVTPTLAPPVFLATSPAAPTTAPTNPAKLCDQAEAGVPIDVTIPDDTRMTPGQTFTKVWRLRNAGTCTWSRKYTFAVFSGEPLNAPSNVPLPKQVEPGQIVDISVDLTAPTNPGTYQGNWKLRNESETWFGIGPGGNSPFWVRVVVVGGTVTPATTTPGTTTSVTPSPTLQPTAAVNPPVQTSGSNTLSANDRLNLDNNQLNAGGEDVALQPNAQGRLLLVTQGNAGMAGFGGSAPSYGQCQSAAPGSASVTVRNLPQGFYVCYRTDQGFFGWLRIAGFNESSGILNVEINTWALP